MTTADDTGHESKSPWFSTKPHSCCQEWGAFHTSPLCARQGPLLRPVSHPLSRRNSASASAACHAGVQQVSSDSRSNVCFTRGHSLGRRDGGGTEEEHRVRSGGEVCRGVPGPSVPISCELPQMKGRNWKSSRPHTPWLPAGSILYVFWSFRITSRYLHRRVGKRGEAEK